MPPPDALGRLWLARSLAAMAPALRALASDPVVVTIHEPVAGFAPPIPPTPAELDAAAGTIERAASVLRHATGSAGA